ncbi:hypothetical protein HKM21_12365 [Longimicrobium terrae]|uniref:Uncharacterized protein n=1 Tax=Longimicrobium terrae TaxID=1639882 RepID=A0A841H0M7_9BACT|nr:hypothetical protein [Longimicrobium terrae]NNC30060.1 hypothetical protein [Longimicrobium terrae]
MSASQGDAGSGEEDDRAWDAELLRRVTEIRNGTAETFSAESVFAEAEQRFG